MTANSNAEQRDLERRMMRVVLARLAALPADDRLRVERVGSRGVDAIPLGGDAGQLRLVLALRDGSTVDLGTIERAALSRRRAREN